MSVFKKDKCGCPGPPSRRDFLRIGALSGLGLTLGDYFQLQTASALEPKAQSVIFVFLPGGMSHIDSWDPKPNAPIEYRGELGSVATSSGDVFGGLLQKCAQAADKMTVIRSMSHNEAAHERGTHNMLTGYRPSPAIAYPSIGSVISHELGPKTDVPSYICIPDAGTPELGTGYLSTSYGPFSVGGSPESGGFSVRDLNLPEGVDLARNDRRRNLLTAVDAHFRDMESSDLLEAMDSYYQRAYALISSQEAREAFAIQNEPDEMRDLYGRHAAGQRLLLARRLVEGGARFITTLVGGWDHHENIKGALQGQLTELDQALAGLLTDLDNRGLLDTTMVVVCSEFGRTVKLNPDGGRDHWPGAFSVMMAGGGIKRGIIHGSTDPRGGEPADSPVGPEDMAATIFTQLGIDPARKLMSPGNRPIDIVRGGKSIQAILA